MKHPSLQNLVSPTGDSRGDEPPAEFRTAVASLGTIRPRPEIVVQETPPPARLAPFTHALAARIDEPELEGGDEPLEIASARFIVLYDAEGHEAWEGTTRIVGYLSAIADGEPADDTRFSQAAWDRVTAALAEAGAAHHSLGGTVTRTASSRFGALAQPEPAVDLEIRASWTAEGTALDRHLAAWLDVFGTAAGLPPAGGPLPDTGERSSDPS